jgi:prepilin-type N-terminal cleavage/methylation domain-containing protein
MKRRRGKSQESGFTLVEVMVALTVIAIGLMGLSVVFPLALEDVGESGVNLRAMELCKDKLESLHRLSYDHPYLLGTTHADSLNPIDGVYTRTWQVYDDQPITGCKRIEVSVTWDSYGSGELVLATVLASAGR